MSEIRECKVGEIIRLGDFRFITCGYGFKRKLDKAINKLEPKLILVNYDTYKFSGKVDIREYPIFHKIEGEFDKDFVKLINEKFINKEYNIFDSSSECEKWIENLKFYTVINQVDQSHAC